MSEHSAEDAADEYLIIWTPDRMESYYFERVIPPGSGVDR